MNCVVAWTWSIKRCGRCWLVQRRKAFYWMIALRRVLTASASTWVHRRLHEHCGLYAPGGRSRQKRYDRKQSLATASYGSRRELAFMLRPDAGQRVFRSQQESAYRPDA